jgi:hypothetical protein
MVRTDDGVWVDESVADAAVRLDVVPTPCGRRGSWWIARGVTRFVPLAGTSERSAGRGTRGPKLRRGVALAVAGSAPEAAAGSLLDELELAAGMRNCGPTLTCAVTVGGVEAASELAVVPAIDDVFAALDCATEVVAEAAPVVRGANNRCRPLPPLMLDHESIVCDAVA